MKDESINRRKLWRYVKSKLKKAVDQHKIYNVIIVLFEEMLIDLKDGKEIIINNFGTLALKPTKPRKFFCIAQKKLRLSKGYKIMKFNLKKSIRNKLNKHLDTGNSGD